MNYPLISEYIEAIKSPEDNFEELTNLRPVLGDDGQPIMTSGNFAVVFKMKDEQSGKMYAVKCFTREQEGRAESYKLIAEELEFVSSNYLTPIKFFEKELFVDTEQTDEDVFPVLMMDWVEGKTLDKYLHDKSDNRFLIDLLLYQFCKMASWLLSQPFAHGDLKPDNILVREDGKIVLVDYDGMYVPTMKGQKAKEIGSPGFRHPKRTEDIFDENIDDFAIALIAMSLKAFSLKNDLINKYCTGDSFFFAESDFVTPNTSTIITVFQDLLSDEEFCSLYGTFMIAFAKNSLSWASPKLFSINSPKERPSYGDYLYSQAREYCEENKDKRKIDHKKAFKLFLKAAYLGNAEAQCCVGCCLRNGYGVEVDYTKAKLWYYKSSMNGYARAFRHLGFCYQDGLGVEKDINKSIELYNKAIELGDVESLRKLGDLFCYGNGVEKNVKEAIKWYKTYAEKNTEKIKSLVLHSVILSNNFSQSSPFASLMFKASENTNENLYSFGITIRNLVKEDFWDLDEIKQKEIIFNQFFALLKDEDLNELNAYDVPVLEVTNGEAKSIRFGANSLETFHRASLVTREECVSDLRNQWLKHKNDWNWEKA